MIHDYSEVFDTDNELWQRVIEIYAKNEKYEKKIVSGRNLHHKFPRSFSKKLGEPVDNDKDNLISLSLADHFLVHYYYYKLAKKGYRQSMATAFTYMARKGLKYITADTAEEMAKDYAEASTIANKAHSETMTGRKQSEEVIRKRSEAMKGKNKGKKLSDERRKQISEYMKGRTLSEETKRKISEASSRRKVKEDTKLKISKGNKGKMKGRTWKVIDGHRQWL